MKKSYKKSFRKLSQVAFEFLMNYAWVLIAALIVIFAFSKFYPVNSCQPNLQLNKIGLTVEDQSITSMDSGLLPSRNLFYVSFKNNLGSDIVIKNINLLRGETPCGSISGLNLPLYKNEMTNVLIGRITNSNCMGYFKKCYHYDFSVGFSYLGRDITHTTYGTMSGLYSQGGSFWSLNGSWLTYNVAGSALVLQDRTGESINYCINETPPIYSALTASVPSGIVVWDQPSGCDISGITDPVNGFAGASCNPRSQLAKTWLHNTLYIDQVFSSYSVFLGGNATYYDNVDNELKTNGICLNDNLYIYVNGALKYYGGTSGKMVGDPDKYDSGDEVLKGCGNCDVVDTSAWCIPSFQLTTNGFNFGQTNNIDILVEDFCKGTGMPHAGGMSDLNIQIV